MSGLATLSAAPKRKATRLKPAARSRSAKSRGDLITTGEKAGGDLISTPANGTVFFLPPSELAVHPDLRDVAAPSAAEDAQLEESIREQGILHPLIANSAKQVLDGGRRLGKALRLGLPTVPVICDDRADAVAVALSTALARRHLSKGQRALYLFKLHRDTSREALAQRTDSELSFRELERRYGLCYTLFVHLNNMRKESTPEEWTTIVSKIESGDSSLTEQYKGFLGRRETKERTRPPEKLSNHSIRMRRGIVVFGQEAKHWKHFGTEKRNELTAHIDAAFGKLDPDLLGEVIRIASEKRAAKGTPGQ